MNTAAASAQLARLARPSTTIPLVAEFQQSWHAPCNQYLGRPRRENLNAMNISDMQPHSRCRHQLKPMLKAVTSL
jgi:hypothetical protein